ncbi:MAG: c-type cytochrome biogenesis protein CcsB, partial [Nonomuraea sp.]|nr:c-type cytochrome biogenesis protein CcsB [Nonomuraea sp.]
MSAEQLAELSDYFVVAAVLLYIVAMVGFAMELAFGRAVAGKAGAAVKQAAKQPVAVGASGAQDPGPEAAEPVP